MVLSLLLTVLILGYPGQTASVSSAAGPREALRESDSGSGMVSGRDAAVSSIEVFLKRNSIDESQLARVAQSIVASARKHNLDPRLIASIMIVESRANPFAISDKDSVGMMQIHLPTWGATADQEGINLFKIEDNVDFGARILKNYVRRFGLWDGVKRYKGWLPENTESEQGAEEYRAKVRRIFGIESSDNS